MTETPAEESYCIACNSTTQKELVPVFDSDDCEPRHVCPSCVDHPARREVSEDEFERILRI